MKAMRYSAYGTADVLKFEEVEKPVPGDDEVLIRVRAASVNAPDYHLMKGRPAFARLFLGLRKPKVKPGSDVAGEVEAVGRNVTEFRAGDEVFGSCKGAFAEYACASASVLAIKPAGLSFEQAAAVPMSGYTALQGLRDIGRVRPGQKVLITGAAGGVGTFAVQIAKVLGAEVTAVCSPKNVEMLRSIGADHVVDSTRDDFTKGGERYDVIFDLVANRSLVALRRALKPEGICVGAGIRGMRLSVIRILARFARAFVLSRLGSRKFVNFIARLNKPDLNLLCQFLQSGRLKPVIDHSYTLGEVPQAVRYLEEGHARGKVVITVAPA